MPVDDPEKATRLLINRLLHSPSEMLRNMAAQDSGGSEDIKSMERALNRLFGLYDDFEDDQGTEE